MENTQGKLAQALKTAAQGLEAGNGVTLHMMQEVIEATMEWFLENEGVGAGLTGADRKRLVGSGVRNNGFIDKAFDIANDNPSFMPPHFDVKALNASMKKLEEYRQFSLVLQQFWQASDNKYLVQSDSCYRDSLRIYSSLREQAKGRVDGAGPLYKALQMYFSRRRKPSGEDAESELERHVKQLVEGEADGEIVIKNESPHSSGGLHEVIDNVHKETSAFKKK